MDKKIIVVGSTGFLGSRICRDLYNRDYSITALIRPQSDTKNIDRYISRFITSELTSIDRSVSLIKGLGIENVSIIYAAGSVNYTDDYETSRDMNVVPVECMVKISLTLQEAGILDKLVFVSSVAARGFLNRKPSASEYINEQNTYYKRGVSVYCDVKHESEGIVRDAVIENKLRAVISSPGSLVGGKIGSRGTTSTKIMEKIIKNYPVLCGGASYTSVDRVAEGVVLALEKGRPGESYLLGGVNMTMRNFAALVKKILKNRFNARTGTISSLVAIPRWIGFILGRLNININKQQAVMGSGFHYVDHTKAERELGYRHSLQDLEDSIYETLSGMR